MVSFDAAVARQTPITFDLDTGCDQYAAAWCCGRHSLCACGKHNKLQFERVSISTLPLRRGRGHTFGVPRFAFVSDDSIHFVLRYLDLDVGHSSHFSGKWGW